MITFASLFGWCADDSDHNALFCSKTEGRGHWLDHISCQEDHLFHLGWGGGSIDNILPCRQTRGGLARVLARLIYLPQREV